jgi:transcriptional regulator with XRE-family HTH domain
MIYSFAYKRKTMSHAELVTKSTESLSKNIGATIRKLRKQQKLTQQRLATLTKTARPSLSKIENGIVLPSLNTLSRISIALGVELKELFTRICHKTDN